MRPFYAVRTYNPIVLMPRIPYYLIHGIENLKDQLIYLCTDSPVVFNCFNFNRFNNLIFNDYYNIGMFGNVTSSYGMEFWK